VEDGLAGDLSLAELAREGARAQAAANLSPTTQSPLRANLFSWSHLSSPPQTARLYVVVAARAPRVSGRMGGLCSRGTRPGPCLVTSHGGRAFFRSHPRAPQPTISFPPPTNSSNLLFKGDPPPQASHHPGPPLFPAPPPRMGAADRRPPTALSSGAHQGDRRCK
jgi:hypothetical protein